MTVERQPYQWTWGEVLLIFFPVIVLIVLVLVAAVLG